MKTKEKVLLPFFLILILISIFSFSFADELSDFSFEKIDESANVSIKKDGKINYELNSNFRITKSDSSKIVLSHEFKNAKDISNIYVFLNARAIDYNLNQNKLEITIDDLQLDKEYNLGIKYDTQAYTQDYTTYVGLFNSGSNNITLSRNYIASVSFSFEEPFNKDNIILKYYSPDKMGYIQFNGELYYPANNVIFGAINTYQISNKFDNMELQIKDGYFETLPSKPVEKTSGVVSKPKENVDKTAPAESIFNIFNQNIIEKEITRTKSIYTGPFAIYKTYTIVSIVILAVFQIVVSIFSYIDNNNSHELSAKNLIKFLINVHLVLIPFIANYIITIYSKGGNSTIYNYAKIVTVVFFISNFIIAIQKDFLKTTLKIIPTFWMFYTFFFIHYMNIGHITNLTTLYQFLIIEIIHTILAMMVLETYKNGIKVPINQFKNVVLEIINKIKNKSKKLRIK